MFDLILRAIIIGTFAFLAIGFVWVLVQTVRRAIESRKRPRGTARHSAGGSDDHDTGGDDFSSGFE